MGVDAYLLDAQSQNGVVIDSDGALQVCIVNRPPLTGNTVAIPFGQRFVNSAGSSDLRVNGATTPQDFYIQADDDKDSFIQSISIYLADQGATLDKFGALTALTVGLQFGYQNTDIGESIIDDEIKTNLTLIRLGQRTGAVGTGVDSYLLDINGSGADAYLPLIDLADTFGSTYGIRLRAGTSDRLFFRVNDNLSAGLDAFNIKAFGLKL